MTTLNWILLIVFFCKSFVFHEMAAVNQAAVKSWVHQLGKDAVLQLMNLLSKACKRGAAIDILSANPLGSFLNISAKVFLKMWWKEKFNNNKVSLCEMQHSPCTGQHHLQHLRDENTSSKEYIDIYGCSNYHLVSNSSTVIKELTTVLELNLFRG